MNRYLRFVLPALAIIFIFNVGASSASAQVLREILNRMDANNKSLKSLKSKIQMAKTDAVLNETDLQEGELNYLPGKSENQIYVNIKWLKPREEMFIVANGKYLLYRPALKQAIAGKVDSVKGKGSKAGGVLSFMSMSRAQLAANYDVKYVGDETVKSGAKAFHLLLVPKTAMSYKSADLWVDANGMPVQAKIVERNNDTTTVLLSDVDRNATVPASLFKFTPPKGTAIVQG